MLDPITPYQKVRVTEAYISLSFSTHLDLPLNPYETHSPQEVTLLLE